MAVIRIFSKVLAILFAVILITAPISTALAAGDSWKDNTQKNKPTYDKSQDQSKDDKSKDDESHDNKPEKPSQKDEDDEKSHHKLKDRLKSLQSISTPPLNLKQQAHEDISSIIPVENKNNKDIIKKLDNAKLHIAASIDPNAWHGENRLKPVQKYDDDDDDSEDGDDDNDEEEEESEYDLETTVFKDERTAAKNILEIISKNKDGAIDDDLLIDILINLVQADRNIAQISITDMQRAVAITNLEDNDESEDADNDNDDLQRKLKKALKDFDKANEKIEKGEPIDAIKHFEKAWEHATTELVNLDAATVPVIIFDSVDNPYINSTDILLLGHVEDAAVYTIPNITLTVNGAASVLDLTGGAFESPLSLHEGDNNISATVTDAFGNTDTANITLIVDTVLPVISFDGAQDGLYYNTLVSVSANMSDEHPDTLTILVNGNPYTSGTPIIAEDAYTVDITARDMAGNTARQSLTFHIDMTPPVITIAEPANGSFVSGAVTVNHIVTDESPVITSTLVDGINIIPADSVGTYVVDTTAYADGMHNITVTAKDAAGNTATEGISILVDNTPPEVTILKPLDNEGIRGMREILAHVYDLYLKGITISINEEEVSTTSNHTFDTLNYSDGSYNISAQAVDYANNTGADAISVIVDNTPPVIDITSPVNNSFVKGAVSVDANITEANTAAVNVTIDGILLSSSVPAAWDTTIYPDGPHTAGVYVTDTADNTAAASASVTVDNTPPAVSLTAPANGSALRGIVDITADIHDTYLADTGITINGTVISNTSNYTWNTTAYPDGWYNITATAADMAENTGKHKIWVEVDNTPPELSVNELTDNPTLKKPEYRINGTVEAGATLMVNGINVPHNDSFEYVINVTEGINIITATATDAAGNTAVWTKTRMVDTDSLPDWYETIVTGTDPLDGDSDSSLTPENEAGNGIKDSNEDLDSDDVLNKEEFAYGIDPLNPDTDDDGLTDWYELHITWTDPVLVDSDENGVDDPDEDMDADRLNNIMEQMHNTNPFSNDTDDDYLSDHREISELGTDPLKKDTDDDFLDDSIELKPFFNTDPLDPDTNDNGILDGHELYEQNFGNLTLGVEVTINTSDNREDTLVFEDVGDKLQFNSNIFVNEPVDILSTDEFSTMKLKMYYNETSMGTTEESDIAMFYFDEVNHSILLLENQGANTDENYVWAQTDHLSVYFIGDKLKYTHNFFGADEPTIPLYTAGEIIKIHAKVHNLEQTDAKNVKVAFYNGDPDTGGKLLGTDIIASVGGKQSAMASLEWTVESNNGINIFVKVDSSNLIAETSESNNVANVLFDKKIIDSDADGLTDYDEIYGMRTGMGLIFYTDPNNPDTDGDGLNDGEEMGPIMEYTQGTLKGEHYYFLFSYPVKNVLNSIIGNSVDSDLDGLSDKVEYDFGSSGLDKDTDEDKLNDFEEHQLGTLPRNPDTDLDGLTDGWEAMATTTKNKYGPTDPLNRDSDNDGAIDGGESNIYPDTPIDIDGDGVSDSGKTMDLNGDGIIEMGEENYYETPPYEYTYFVDVFMVVDEEYKDKLRTIWNPDRWKDISIGAINDAGEHFLSTYQIKLNISQIDDSWDSDEDKLGSSKLLEEAMNEMNWIGWDIGTDNHNSDILVAFTGQDSYLNPLIFHRSYGVAFPASAATITKIPPPYIGKETLETDNLVQHEISHLFGVPDHEDNRYCIMDKTWPSRDKPGEIFGNIWTTHYWDLECFNIIESTKSEVSLFKENGDYDIIN